MRRCSPNDLPIVMAVDALALMRKALALLERAGAGLAANRLQHAIETFDPLPPLSGEGTKRMQ